MGDTGTMGEKTGSQRRLSFLMGTVTSFKLMGIVDFGFAAADATGMTLWGGFVGLVTFATSWVLLGLVAALIVGLLWWIPTGSSSITNALVSTCRRWWRERGTDADGQRLVAVFCVVLGLSLFAVGSVLSTAHLIETRNGPLVIAAVAFAIQVALATGLTLGCRGLFRALSPWVSRRPRLLSAPVFVAGLATLGVTAAIAAILHQWELFLAVEGPSFLLVGLAICLIPVCDLAARRFTDPLAAYRATIVAVIVAPFLFIALVGVASQQPQARRLVVIHAQTAAFIFSTLQQELHLDRLFYRADCPPLGPDGLPIDGMSFQKYEAECMDPAYDRPFHRPVAPEVERPEFDQPPSFVFITWDSVRVDRLGFMGHDRDTTPYLDAFAAENLVFDRAFAADSGTGPSFWSLMTGQTPFQVQLEEAHRFPPLVSEEEPLLGEALSEAGYRTEAVMCGAVFDSPRWTIRRGFDRFRNVCGRDLNFLAPRVLAQATETLERLATRHEPFFLWVHFYDPHHPYTNHEEIGFGTSRLDRYDEELRYTDEHTGRLLEQIAEVAEDRPLFTILSADHGENFDEHGSDPHARNLYRIVTQVPKIVSGPGIVPRRVDAPVALNDLYPTVLDLAGIDIPENTTMVSQVPVFFGADPDPGRMVFQENSYSRPRRHTRAVVYDRYHYIMDLTTGTQELYDYVDDPMERNNLIGTGLIEERILRQALARFLQTSRVPEGLD